MDPEEGSDAFGPREGLDSALHPPRLLEESEGGLWRPRAHGAWRATASHKALAGPRRPLAVGPQGAGLSHLRFLRTSLQVSVPSKQQISHRLNFHAFCFNSSFL